MSNKSYGISAVLITFNEAQNLRTTLDALREVADEILVVDSFSTDGTVEIARECGALVTQVEWEGYSKAKNFGNSKATFSYILSIDADEVLDRELKNSILETKKAGFSGAYRLNRKNLLEGKWVKYSGWYPDRKLRLFPVEKANWEGDYVHENLILDEGISISDLSGHLVHNTARDRAEHLRTIRRYNELQARKMIDQGRPYSIVKSTLQALSTFVRCLLLRKGFLDGKTGWNIAIRSAYGRIWRYKAYKKLIREA